MPSNSKLELGVGNSSNDPTVILASIDKHGKSNFSLDRAILEAGPTDFVVAVPRQPFIGLLGRGSEGNDSVPMPAMQGVVGYGGRSDTADPALQAGSGVAGVGGGTYGHQPGAGVYGLGGTNEAPGSGLAHGPGVIGVCDGIPAASGAPTLDRPPPPERTAKVGVYGESMSGPGVKGNSASGDGVHGQSETGRGAVFEAGRDDDPRSQARLVPVASSTLPKDGRFGDLFVRVVDDANRAPSAEMWLCIREPLDGQTALWGQLAFSITQFAP